MSLLETLVPIYVRIAETVTDFSSHIFIILIILLRQYIILFVLIYVSHGNMFSKNK